jgi:2-succinyl-5-enolpyruvyl-6-hydroxy-3-cyclohexene-1-carboxylate synthase
MSTRARLGASPTLASLWAELLVEELVRQGVAWFVVAPGARSAPLALAVAAHPRAEMLVHWDERAAAFAALGWGRATGRPAALVTTSGTAVANALPAAVEAAQDGVPLLLLTADRPPELRDTGANQTIRQPGLFASVARWAADLPVPSAGIAPAFVLTTAAQAVARTLSPAGPVHLNIPFREPLAPVPDGTDAAALLAALGAWPDSDAPFTRTAPPPAAPDADAVADLAGRLAAVERGLVLLGSTEDDAAPAAERLAERLGWPLLPDLASGARLGAAGATTCAAFDLALAGAAFRDAHRPDAVLHVGRRMTSKRLLQHVEASAPALYAVVRPDGERFDPTHQATHRVQAGAAAFCKALADALPARAPTTWLGAWRAASDAAARAADDGLDAAGLSEPGVARAVSRLTPAGHALFVAASMPVRDLDLFAASDGPALRVAANRGASGIDGTVASAAGFARGLGRPATLLIGDLALLHDQTSLALLRDGPPVVVVAVNNDGGGIFHFLPVAGAVGADAFERVFGAPHGLGFAHAAHQVGLAYHAPQTAEAFASAYGKAVRSGRSALIEVRTERAANRALHAALAEQAGAAADAAA